MIWYPYAQMKTMPTPYEIVDASGIYLYTKDKKLIDSISSWWSVIHGYNHPEMNQAIHEQVERFSHVMLGGLTHVPAQKLAAKLQSWLPGDLDYTFFSDSGSVAVEVALKMALQYAINRGEAQRTMVLALEHAYHGDTFKAMEVGDDEDYHFVLKAYGPSQHVLHIPTQIDALERAFEVHHRRLNCMIVEPLLQGAGGMRMYNAAFLQRARELCDAYGVLLIFDEVATGFGRTGNRFVADLVLPDILVLGKALTGGYIGHAATVAREKVFHAFYDDDPSHAFMHGPTFMGNALACAAALKSIELFETQDYLAKIRRIKAITRQEMRNLRDPRIQDVRFMGGCVCVETKEASTLRGYQQFAYDRGIFSRPFLRYLYAMVPYVIDDDSLVQVLDTMKVWFQRTL
ncbi:MAG TPA: adenosylmethionine--8-amino-7-oxononanoate transaminase [Candidatus Ornithocaccomicrobium faecavium]|mgnify:CR=1 FL=1|uniref:Adenosylmethionine-8-amino-7-oxononanoate aminotransferase n=1 Tax=Candidatus Ornithocaccomicrobium faecavium TaxID=2840890 RepID=A0A9D1TDE4_9FIRM|nr:adenosylmethionine--8-amino-7-oxononanoate transaminase [Candidatus Ornithocaccomicrobium faecavium]